MDQNGQQIASNLCYTTVLRMHTRFIQISCKIASNNQWDLIFVKGVLYRVLLNGPRLLLIQPAFCYLDHGII